MTQYWKYNLSFFLFVTGFQLGFSQVKKPAIGTETVDVVKPFSPSISDAFKFKESPVIELESNAKKETVNYTIFSYPVASTFTPSKGVSQGVEKEQQEVLFKNQASFGVGNYGVLNADLFVTENISHFETLGGMFRHHSSQGGIKSVELDDFFYDTAIDLNYSNTQRDLAWKVDFGYKNQIYNWYGLPTNFGNSLAPADRAILIKGIKEQQSYNTFSLGGNVDFVESVFEKVGLQLNHFSDAFGSTENRLLVKPSFKVEVLNQVIKTKIVIDHVGGSFKKEYWQTNLQPIKYGFTNLGFEPTLALDSDDWTLNIGTGLFFNMDNEKNKNRFFVYPKVTVSYKVVGDLMIFYAGAEGNLEQNSYQEFVSKNSFLSPTINIAPTDNKYDVYAGLKGKLANNVNYTIQGSYINEANKALFKSNDFKVKNTNEGYAFGNSFQVVYDAVKTIRFYGQIKADFSKNVSFALDGTFSSYTSSVEKEAWNLPGIQVNSKLDFILTPKWFAGVNVFYVGERSDQKLDRDILYLTEPSPITLASYFDVNAHVGYKYSTRLSGFLRANNIANQRYDKWLDYQVQGFQVVLGANYKFDF
jgi:hypothetical protein